MSTSRAGLKQIGFCDAGTLATTKTNPLAIGLRNAASMEITNFKQIKDYLERNFRNMKNFKVDAESLQPTIQMLKLMISWLNLGCDAQVITRPQASGGAGDVYKFIGDNKAGLDFEYLINADKRSMKATLELAMEYVLAQTFIDSADSETAVVLTDITGEGADFTRFKSPYFVSFESPKTTALFSKADLVERSLTIKTKNKKDLYNKSIVDFLTVELMIKARDASVAKQIVAMGKDQSPSVYVKEMNTGAYYDAFDFAAGVLTLEEEYKDGDDDRTLQYKFTGNIHIYDITFELGDTHGGAVSDTIGSTGGTMKAGY
ncbi:MAG: hypothetical protein PHX51_07160 [Clostridia bacterium]|nr:hypothetical protein [Clostridia bacterium]